MSTVIRLDRLFLDHRTLSTRVNGFVAFVIPPHDHAISSVELSRLCGRVIPAFGSYWLSSDFGADLLLCILQKISPSMQANMRACAIILNTSSDRAAVLCQQFQQQCSAFPPVTSRFFSKNYSSGHFEFKEISSIEVLTALRKLPSGKSVGLDHVSNELLKLCACSAVCSSLATLCNMFAVTRLISCCVEKCNNNTNTQSGQECFPTPVLSTSCSS